MHDPIGDHDAARVTVVIPVRSFDGAKTRLADHLDARQRSALARRMATTVLEAASGLDVVVVTGDPDVATWAVERDASVVDDPGTGLDGAVTAGVAAAAVRGATRVVVAHADLPAATDLRPLADLDAPVVLVPDRRGDGTNVIVVDVSAGFRFRYGPGSFERHRDEAARIGVRPMVVRDADLGWDVDEPSDLHGLAALDDPTPPGPGRDGRS